MTRFYRAPALRPEGEAKNQSNQQAQEEDQIFNDLMARYGYSRENQTSSQLREDSDDDDPGIFHLTSPSKKES